MYQMKLKNGRRGVAIVSDPRDAGNNWEIDKPLPLSKSKVKVEIDDKEIEVYSSPMIKFHILWEDFIPELKSEKEKKHG